MRKGEIDSGSRRAGSQDLRARHRSNEGAWKNVATCNVRTAKLRNELRNGASVHVTRQRQTIDISLISMVKQKMKL